MLNLIIDLALLVGLAGCTLVLFVLPYKMATALIQHEYQMLDQFRHMAKDLELHMQDLGRINPELAEHSEMSVDTFRRMNIFIERTQPIREETLKGKLTVWRYELYLRRINKIKKEVGL